MKNITNKITVWFENIIVCPVLLYRYCRFNYTFRRIYLGEGFWTILDSADYYRLRKYRWYLTGNGSKFYAARNIVIGPYQTKIIRMHREIMNNPKGFLVDHRNCNSLDNRLANLRTATSSQNACNRQKKKSKSVSIFRGVGFDKRINKWTAVIYHHDKRIYLGSFPTELDAANAYNIAAIKYHGEFARLNDV